MPVNKSAELFEGALEQSPMKFSHTAFRQMLLGSSDIFALGQVVDVLRPGPSSWEDSRFRKRERPFQVWHVPRICRFVTKTAGILAVDGIVGAA